MEKGALGLLGALAALTGEAGSPELGHARPDFRREERKGVPEVVLATQKTPDQVVEIAEAFLEATGRAIISRVSPSLRSALQERFADQDLETYPLSQMIVIRRREQERPQTGGRVGIITAGTSDLPVAEEAAVITREMGCQVTTVSDVGVAGIHRLFQPLQSMLAASVDVIVVAAGMDGALPSVVAGLVDVPVIGLPTSTGYGLGGRGTAALLSMLQTCSPGLAVVNIDNGIGAGATAGLIANRVARARMAPPLDRELAARNPRSGSSDGSSEVDSLPDLS